MFELCEDTELIKSTLFIFYLCSFLVTFLFRFRFHFSYFACYERLINYPIKQNKQNIKTQDLWLWGGFFAFSAASHFFFFFFFLLSLFSFLGFFASFFLLRFLESIFFPIASFHTLKIHKKQVVRTLFPDFFSISLSIARRPYSRNITKMITLSLFLSFFLGFCFFWMGFQKEIFLEVIRRIKPKL